MKDYIKPMLYSEEFTPNQFIAGCTTSITGNSPVYIYCVKTSHISVFTSSISCTVEHDAFSSVSEATTYFSSLFQWGDAYAEGNTQNNNSWTNAQTNAANQEVSNGYSTLLEGTVDLGGYTTTTSPGGQTSYKGNTHAGYALDVVNALDTTTLGS